MAETALEDVLTLLEGVEREQLAGSRLTIHEARRWLAVAAHAIVTCSSVASSGMPELDVPAWRGVEELLRSGAPLESDAGWLAVRSLVPTTLSWLRLYREGWRERPAGGHSAAESCS